MIHKTHNISGIYKYSGDTEGIVHSVETFGSVDGPGVRYIIFLSGCPLRCKFCHNPDTWNCSGKVKSVQEVFSNALRYKTYWKKNGGITVSGGEPLSQIDFVTALFQLAKENNINTCIDTSGAPFCKNKAWLDKFNELMKFTDLILLDIKHIDEAEHIKLTGKSGKNIKEMALYLSEIQKPVWIRHVLIPEITDNDKYLKETSDFIHTLKNIKRVEILPYHILGTQKWKELGIKYELEGISPPSAERIKNAEELLDIKKYTEWQYL